MAFAPPRKPPSGSRLPSSVRQTTSIRSVTSTSITSIPRSTASSSRTGSCSTGVPCGSSRSGRSSIRPPSTSRGSLGGRLSTGPSMVETTSSTIIEPGRTTTTRTERRIGTAARPLTTPQASIPVPRYQPPRNAKGSGYGMQPRRDSGVRPGASGTRRAPSARGTMETVTSTSSMTIDPDGTETLVEQEQRVVQPVAGPRAAGVCPGARQAPARRARVTDPPPSERPSMGRSSLGGRPSVGGRPSISRTAPRTMPMPPPSMQKATTRTSRATFADGREVTEKSSRTERVPAPRSSGYGPPRRTPAAAPSAVSSTSVTSTVSTGTVPKTKILTTRAAKTSVKGPKKTTTVQEVTKTTPAVLPEGRYALSLKHAPHTKEARLHKFSSPPELRHVMDREMPKAIKSSIMPPEFKGVQDVRKLKAYEPYKDVVSLAMNISRPRTAGPPAYYADPHQYSFLESGIEPEEGEYTPPILDEPTILEQEVGETLVHTAMQSPGKGVKVSGSRKSPAKPHVIMTDHGPVMATGVVISEKKVEKIPGAEKISRHITGIQPAASMPSGGIQMELDTQEIEPSGGLPAKSDTAIETVSVRSAVAVTPGGVKETTTTVIYETTKPPPRTPPRSALLNISPEDVERMVEEEAIDVNKTLRLKPLDLKVYSPKSYTTRKREQELKLTYTSVVELQESIVVPEPSPDQEQEEVQPEMMATIMFTEESKLGLESQPAEMYDLLFPEKRDGTMMTVNSVAPAPLHDILVPHQLPENFHAIGATPEIQTAISTVEVKGDSKPSGNAFCETAGEQTKIKNIARRKKKKLTDVPLLVEEMPPWGVEDMEPLVEAVGAPLRTSLIVTVSTSGEEEEGEAPPAPPEEEDVAIDYMLQLEPPTHISRVQLRGSTRPSWFQGYYLALPEIPNLVRVETTAENALVSAWRAVQPNYFPDDSIITV